MIYLDINNSFLILLIFIIFTFLVNGKFITIHKFIAINIFLAAIFTYIYCTLRISDSNDYNEYALKYLSSYDINFTRFEFGYAFITEICKRINISFSSFYVIIIFICNFILINYTNLIMRKININNILIFPLLFYSALFLNFNFIILRTFIACALLMAMMYYIIINNPKQYIYMFLSVSFQYMVIPVIFIVYVAKYITKANINLSNNIKYNYFIFFLILFSLFNYEILANIYIKYIDIYFPRYKPYNSYNGGWFEGYKRIPITQLVAYTICIYIGIFKIKYNQNQQNLILLINIIMISFLILVFSPFPKINSRIYLFFLPVYFILFALLERYFKYYGLCVIIIITSIYYISNYV